MGWHFRKEMPRLSEFPRQNSRRYAAVPHAKHGTRFAREPMTKVYNEIANCRYKVRSLFNPKL